MYDVASTLQFYSAYMYKQSKRISEMLMWSLYDCLTAVYMYLTWKGTVALHRQIPVIEKNDDPHIYGRAQRIKTNAERIHHYVRQKTL